MKDLHNGRGVIALIACFSSTDVQLLQKHNEGLDLPSLSSNKLPCTFFLVLHWDKYFCVSPMKLWWPFPTSAVGRGVTLGRFGSGS